MTSAPARCNKCGQADAEGGDSWCLACSAVEHITGELKSGWGTPGSRAICTDLLVSCTRQVPAREDRAPCETAPPPPAEPGEKEREPIPLAVNEEPARRDRSESSEGESEESEEPAHDSEVASDTSGLRALPKARAEDKSDRSELPRRRHSEQAEPRRERSADQPPDGRTIHVRDIDPKIPAHGDALGADAGDEKSLDGNQQPESARGAALVTEEVAIIKRFGVLRRILLGGSITRSRIPIGIRAHRSTNWCNGARSQRAGRTPGTASFRCRCWGGGAFGHPPMGKNTALGGIDFGGVPHGQLLGLGILTEDWFAAAVEEVKGSAEEGWLLACVFLGCERESASEEVAATLGEGYVHLCPGDPCLLEHPGPVLHLTRVRFWEPSAFECAYLTKAGKALLKKSLTAEKKRQTAAAKAMAGAGAPRASRRVNRGKGRGGGEPPPGRGGDPKKKPSLISLVSEKDGDTEEDAEPPVVEKRRGALRPSKGLAKGFWDKEKANALAGKKGIRVVGQLPAIPHVQRPLRPWWLGPAKQTPLRMALGEGTSGDAMKSLTKRLAGASTASSALLTQVLEQSVKDSEGRRKKNERNEIARMERILFERLLFRQHRQRQGGLRRRQRPGLRAAAETESGKASRKRHGDAHQACARADGSRGAAGKRRRPRFHDYRDQTVNVFRVDDPALSQRRVAFAARALRASSGHRPILRLGKLMECADALAARFIAVHTALGDGNWLTASQLELYPLEPVQSATTATMLEAQKHRKLVMRSQGWSGGNSRWWPAAGRGKGGGYSEKGKKGDQKGKGKNKSKSQTKEGGWNSKGDVNAWRDSKEDPAKKAP
eukprot:s165_g9.t1